MDYKGTRCTSLLYLYEIELGVTACIHKDTLRVYETSSFNQLTCVDWELNLCTQNTTQYTPLLSPLLLQVNKHNVLSLEMQKILLVPTIIVTIIWQNLSLSLSLNLNMINFQMLQHISNQIHVIWSGALKRKLTPCRWNNI